MKKLLSFTVVFFSFFMFLTAALAEESIPPVPLTPSEVTRAVQDSQRVKNIQANVSKLTGKGGLVDKINNLTAKNGPITNIDDKIDGLTAKGGAITKIGDKIQSLDDNLTGKDGEFEKTRDAITSSSGINIFCTVVILLAIALFGIGVILTIKKRTPNAVPILHELENISKKIDDIPVKTAAEVKKLEPIIIEFETRGKKVSYTPPIINGTYLSLYVPKGQTASRVSDPSKLVRLPIDHRGRLYKSTLGVMGDFFDGKFTGTDVDSQHQEELIRYAQAIGQLKID